MSLCAQTFGHYEDIEIDTSVIQRARNKCIEGKPMPRRATLKGGEGTQIPLPIIEQNAYADFPTFYIGKIVASLNETGSEKRHPRNLPNIDSVVFIKLRRVIYYAHIN